MFDPLSGAAFPGGIVPSSRISRQATALLGLFSQEVTASVAGYNLETPVIRGSHRDAVRALIIKPIGPGHLSAKFPTESVRADESTLFGFLESPSRHRSSRRVISPGSAVMCSFLAALDCIVSYRRVKYRGRATSQINSADKKI